MPKGPQGQKRPGDVVGAAVHVAKIATGEIEETTHSQPAKRKEGIAGGRARATALTPERRSETVRQAATARWR